MAGPKFLEYRYRIEGQYPELFDPIPQPRYDKAKMDVDRYVYNATEYMANRFKERYLRLMDFHKNPNWDKFMETYVPEITAAQDAMMVPVAQTITKANQFLPNSLKEKLLKKTLPIKKLESVRMAENEYADKYTEVMNNIVKKSGDVRRSVERRGPHRVTWDLIESHKNPQDALFISPKGEYVGSITEHGNHLEAVEDLIRHPRSKLKKAIGNNKDLNKLYENISNYQIAIDDKFGGIRIASPRDYMTGTVTDKKLKLIQKYLKDPSTENKLSKITANLAEFQNEGTIIHLDSVDHIASELWSYDIPIEDFMKLKGTAVLKKKYGHMIQKINKKK